MDSVALSRADKESFLSCLSFRAYPKNDAIPSFV